MPSVRQLRPLYPPTVPAVPANCARCARPLRPLGPPIAPVAVLAGSPLAGSPPHLPFPRAHQRFTRDRGHDPDRVAILPAETDVASPSREMGQMGRVVAFCDPVPQTVIP